MLPLANKPSADQPTTVRRPTAPFVVIGNPDCPGNPRVAHFQAALSSLGLPAATTVSYADLLTGEAHLGELLTPSSIVRIESPGRDFAVERALLALGADVEDGEGDYERLTRREVEALTFDKGRLLPSRQWYLGFREALRQIDDQLPGCAVMNPPGEIAVMFDKRLCHARLDQRGVSVPPAFDPVNCYDELIAQMRRRHCYRVFVKLAHGSSAAGVVAYRTSGDRHQAVTTVEMVSQDGQLCLYNSRRLRLYEKASEIAALIDALCRQRVHVEHWLPKAGHAGRTFDLRVVMIAGEVRHVVVRRSQSPLTNLHLLNTRGDLEPVLGKLDATRWRTTCQQAAALFQSLYTGIDLMFTPDYGHHAVLEMNAFGDLLPGVLHNGEDTYAAEILAMLRRVNS